MQDVRVDSTASASDRLEVPEDGPTFADIGGLEEPLRQLRERIEAPLRHPEVFQRLGIEPPRGVLLVGPPGCGKTLIARALAQEAGASFFAVCVTELLDKYVGESERNVRRLFERAAQSAPAIVFLDGIDALGYDRGHARHGWDAAHGRCEPGASGGRDAGLHRRGAAGLVPGRGPRRVPYSPLRTRAEQGPKIRGAPGHGL